MFRVLSMMFFVTSLLGNVYHLTLGVAVDLKQYAIGKQSNTQYFIVSSNNPSISCDLEKKDKKLSLTVDKDGQTIVIEDYPMAFFDSVVKEYKHQMANPPRRASIESYVPVKR